MYFYLFYAEFKRAKAKHIDPQSPVQPMVLVYSHSLLAPLSLGVKLWSGAIVTWKIATNFKQKRGLVVNQGGHKKEIRKVTNRKFSSTHTGQKNTPFFYHWDP